MTSKRLHLGLLAAARAEYKSQILPRLGPDERYVGAMMRRALDVLYAEAEAASDPEAALSEGGFATAAELAVALRQRQVSDSAALRRALRTFVERKLAISKPPAERTK